MNKHYQTYGLVKIQEKLLKEKIDEANARLQVLGDANHLNKTVNVNVLGFNYVVEEIILGVEEKYYHSDGNITFKCSDGADDYEFVASDEFFDAYLGKLRALCAATNTLLFEEAEPQEYAEAKAAAEAMKNPDFKETFAYTEDNTIKISYPIKHPYDNQEVFWQNQGE